MKIEDIQYEISEKEIDEEGFDIEKWRIEHPMDYFKAMHLINTISNKSIVFDKIYDICRYHIPDTLFKYYSLTEDEVLNQQKFKTLKDQTIFMGDVKNLNDPFDSKTIFYNSEFLRKNHSRLEGCKGKLIDDFSKGIKVASFTAIGVNSMPMWAHYADNHKGFCVAYDMNNNIELKKSIFPVQYTKERIDVTSVLSKLVGESEKQIELGKRKVVITDLSIVYIQMLSYNQKHISWSYEKEFRCTTSSGRAHLKAIPKAIYIGLKCLPNHKKELKKIASELKIPIYEMKFDELSENFNLISKKLVFI